MMRRCAPLRPWRNTDAGVIARCRLTWDIVSRRAGDKVRARKKIDRGEAKELATAFARRQPRSLGAASGDLAVMLLPVIASRDSADGQIFVEIRPMKSKGRDLDVI